LYEKHERKAKAQSHQPINRPRASGQKGSSKEFMQVGARGHRYILVMDDFSRYCTAIPLKNKVGSEAATVLMKFIEQLETMTKQKVSQIQADWGGEFRNKDTQKACESKGIILKEMIPHHSNIYPCPPKTPPKNSPRIYCIIWISRI
jgi:transposase InsO family protein